MEKPPQCVRISEAYATNTFMLSSVNGRRALNKIAGIREKAARPCSQCATEAEYECGAECGFLCGVCARTIYKHSKHASTPVPEILSDLEWAAHCPPVLTCSACRVSPVLLPYYACMVCANYIMCSTCDEIDSKLGAENACVHDPTHAMIKHKSRQGAKV